MVRRPDKVAHLSLERLEDRTLLTFRPSDFQILSTASGLAKAAGHLGGVNSDVQDVKEIANSLPPNLQTAISRQFRDDFGSQFAVAENQTSGTSTTETKGDGTQSAKILFDSTGTADISGP